MAEGRGDRARRDAWWPNPRTTWLCTFGENIGGANEVEVGHPVGSRSNWMSTIGGLNMGSNPHPESREWRRGSCLATAQRALGAVGCCQVEFLLLCSSRGPANAHGSIKGGAKEEIGGICIDVQALTYVPSPIQLKFCRANFMVDPCENCIS